MDRGYRLTCTEIALALTTIAICALATASPRQTVIVDRNTGSLVPRNALEAGKRNYSLLAIQNDSLGRDLLLVSVRELSAGPSLPYRHENVTIYQDVPSVDLETICSLFVPHSSTSSGIHSVDSCSDDLKDEVDLSWCSCTIFGVGKWEDEGHSCNDVALRNRTGIVAWKIDLPTLSGGSVLEISINDPNCEWETERIVLTEKPLLWDSVVIGNGSRGSVSLGSRCFVVGSFAASCSLLNATGIFFTLNGFRSGLLLQADLLELGDLNAVQMIGLTDRLLITTTTGLWELRKDNGTDRPHRLLKQSIGEIIVPTQSLVSKVEVLLISSNRRHVYRGASYSVLVLGERLRIYELKGKRNESLCNVVSSETGGDCTLLSLATNPLDSGGEIVVLTKAQVVIVLKETYPGEIEVTHALRIPTCIESLRRESPTRCQNDERRDVDLHSIQFVSSLSTHLLAWGNVLLLSPNAGRTFHAIKSFGNVSITSVATSEQGYYAVYLKHSKSLWIGHAFTSTLHHLPASVDNSLFGFDLSSQFYAVSFEPTLVSSQRCVNRSLVRYDEEFQNSSRGPLCRQRERCRPNPFSCSGGYQIATFYLKRDDDVIRRHVNVVALSNASATTTTTTTNVTAPNATANENRTLVGSNGSFVVGDRQNETAVITLLDQLRFETPVWTLPVRIFLMKRQKWRFGVLVNLTGDEIDIRLNASASTRSVVQIDVVRHEVSNGSYLFEIVIREAAFLHQKQHPSGYGLLTTGVHVQVWVENSSSSSSSSSFLLWSQSLAVHVGCPGGLSLSFDAIATILTVNENWPVWCDVVDVPCFDFRARFKPVFRLNDAVLGTTSPYAELYTLKIVGLGRDRSSIEYVKNERVQRSVWTAVNQTGNDTIFSDGMTWMCGPGSSCSDLKPSNFFESAKFFLLLEFSNRFIGDDYCHFSFQFLIELRVIPMGTVSIITVLSTTLGAAFLLLFLGYGVTRPAVHRSSRACFTATLECFAGQVDWWRRMSSRVRPSRAEDAEWPTTR
ncbi:uncharacterized protein [Oscarella lobularis]|uniref:uncharacterized protein isoform X2 n=1 Tax=Oscarella lobularis TaxID=121494 RepID=UPI003313A2A1